MSAETILNEFGDRQGWNDESKLAICQEYIDNQQDEDGFSDFVAQKAGEERLEATCMFTSVWDTGPIITTKCVYDQMSGRVEPEVFDGPAPTGNLEREFITLEDGDELEVCPNCHEYVLRTVMGDRADCSYGEMKECPNPDCAEAGNGLT